MNSVRIVWRKGGIRMARNKFDQDESLEVKFDLNQVKRLLKYVRPYRKKMILTVALMLI